MSTLSFKQIFSLTFLLAVALLVASILQAWTGPTAAAPLGNVAAPINVGTADQVKDAGISVNALTVFGSQYIQNKLGINVTNPLVALDVSGTLRLGNGGEQCQAVSEGSQRYNSTSKVMEYCNGTSWTAFGTSTSTGEHLTGIRTFTSSGTWTKPSGVSHVLVYVTGGGGPGGPCSFPPWGSGYIGGTSSFGSSVSATGGGCGGGVGGGGQAGGGGSVGGGTGGSASGGDVNLFGGDGHAGYLDSSYANQSYAVPYGGEGGSSYWGGGGKGDASQNGIGASSGRAYGSGGGGQGAAGGGAGGTAIKFMDVSSVSSVAVTIGAAGYSGSNSGGASGASGIVVVYEYGN